MTRKGPAIYIKICGLSTEASVEAGVAAGVDAIGFVFAPRSVRFVEPERAATLGCRIPDGVERVGVFQDASLTEVRDVARRARLTTVQLHGTVEDADVHALRDEGLRPIRALSAARFAEYRASARSSERLLLDAEEPGAGVPFDVTALGGHRPTGFWLLAGGLTPENVAERIRALAPSGVDVSSGVESERGVKSLDRIAAFVDAVRATDAEPPDAEPTDAGPAAVR